MEKHLIHNSPKNTFKENTSTKNTSSKNTPKRIQQIRILMKLCDANHL